MNHMMSIARSAGQVCARYTAQSLLTLRELASTLQINSYTQPVDNLVQKVKLRLRHSHVIHMLDMAGMLSCKSPSRAHRKPLMRIACGVAIALVGALCLPMSEASSGDINAIQPKDYIRLVLDDKEALCLIKLYGKESAFNPYAIGNLEGKYHTYGIPQLKNALIAEKSPIQQIDYGIKYIDHRYDGDACKALHHWKIRGWH